ncbi:MAG: hypothetical protein U0414_16200 [Polyangiaceae bacterium]
MTTDVIVTLLTVGVVLAFAAFVTVHAATVFGLFRLRRVRAAVAALVLPPLAPWLAVRYGMRGRAIGWLVAAPVYTVALLLAGTRAISFGGP